ncbi:hypothetical protein OROMI_004806 [Orobanche minor]
MARNPLVILLEKNLLSVPNFIDWLRNLMIILNIECLGYVLEVDIPSNPVRTRGNQEEIDVHEKWVKDDVLVCGFMMGSMTNELHRAHEKITSTRKILAHLTELYGEHSRTTRYEISKQLFSARMKEGEKVGDHVLKMISMIERLEVLNFYMDLSLQSDLILQSLPDSFMQFVMNFNCNEISYTLAGIMNKLVTAQSNMKTKPRETAIVISSGPQRSKNKKKKTYKQYKPKKRVQKGKGKALKVQKVGGPKPTDKCLVCYELAHWRRTCPKVNGAPGMELLVFETNYSATVYSASWILDSSTTSYICTMNQDLERSRKLGAWKVMVIVGSR